MVWTHLNGAYSSVWFHLMFYIQSYPSTFLMDHYYYARSNKVQGSSNVAGPHKMRGWCHGKRPGSKYQASWLGVWTSQCSAGRCTCQFICVAESCHSNLPPHLTCSFACPLRGLHSCEEKLGFILPVVSSSLGWAGLFSISSSRGINILVYSTRVGDSFCRGPTSSSCGGRRPSV